MITSKLSQLAVICFLCGSLILLAAKIAWSGYIASIKIYDTLENFRLKAESSSNRLELVQLRSDLYFYCRVNAWYRGHQDEARNIKSYIDGKLSAIK